MKQMKTLFVTGTGTGIGKTLVTATLAHQLRAAGRSIRVVKPVVTGLDTSALSGDLPSDLSGTDPGILMSAVGEAPTRETLERMSPFRYAAPLAPSLAAAKEGRSLDFDALVTFCRKGAEGPEDLLLIEGVGGVMVPLQDTRTVLDWIAMFATPVLLVTGSYLGALSHTLTALESLHGRGCPVHAIVVSQSEGASVGLHDTIAGLVPFTAAPIFAFPRVDGAEPWRRAPDLTAITASL